MGPARGRGAHGGSNLSPFYLSIRDLLYYAFIASGIVFGGYALFTTTTIRSAPNHPASSPHNTYYPTFQSVSKNPDGPLAATGSRTLTGKVVNEHKRQWERTVCFQRLQHVFLERIQLSLRPGSRNYLLGVTDFHNDNLGHGVQWQGELQAMAMLGMEVHAQCQVGKCPFDSLKAVLEGTPVQALLHAPSAWDIGNKEVATLRYNALKSFADQRVVLLPDHVEAFKADETTREYGDMLQHPDLHAYVRDTPSFNFVQLMFSNVKNIQLIPDASFMLAPMAPACVPDVDVLYLAANNPQTAQATQRKLLTDFLRSNISFIRHDWNDAYDVERERNPLYTTRPRLESVLPLSKTGLANRMLCRGRVVVTDRAVASFVSAMLDRPVVIIDAADGPIASAWNAIDMLGGQTCSEGSLMRQRVDDVSQVTPVVRKFLQLVGDMPSAFVEDAATREQRQAQEASLRVQAFQRFEAMLQRKEDADAAKQASEAGEKVGKEGDAEAEQKYPQEGEMQSVNQQEEAKEKPKEQLKAPGKGNVNSQQEAGGANSGVNASLEDKVEQAAGGETNDADASTDNDGDGQDGSQGEAFNEGVKVGQGDKQQTLPKHLGEQ